MMNTHAKHTLRVVILVVMTMALSGCKLFDWRESFEFKGARVVGFNLSEGATVEMTIENRLPFKVTITAGELEGFYKGSAIGQIYMREPVVLPRKSTTTVTVQLGLRFSSLSAALSAVRALSDSPDDITVSGYGEGKVLWFTKRMERKDVPMSKFISIFGSPSKYLNL